jgi:hypothetical protein
MFLKIKYLIRIFKDLILPENEIGLFYYYLHNENILFLNNLGKLKDHLIILNNILLIVLNSHNESIRL